MRSRARTSATDPARDTPATPDATTRAGLGRPTRRGILALGGAATLVACTPRRDAPASPATTTAPAASAVDTPVPGPSSTIANLISNRPFYVAHRGSGDTWTEHTALAYARSAAAGALAIEVSVNATSDGVFVCHHDKTTERLTGVDRTIARTTWADLRTLRNDAREWLGPATGLEPIPQLWDVLREHVGRRVVFVEDKQGTNTDTLLDVLDRFPTSRDHVVWKQWAGSRAYRAARERGYRTWGYFTEDILDRVDELAPNFDYLGVPHTATDDQVRAVVAAGKPVICWEVHTRAMRDRLSRLGVVGMMCSNLQYVTSERARYVTDRFGTGRRAPGDLPWQPIWSAQPTIDEDTATVRIDHPQVASYCMGSMCPVPGPRRRISAEMRWPDRLPAARQHAGIAFGQADDTPYRPFVAGPVAGYHLVLRADGELGLFQRAAGVGPGTPVASVRTDPPRPGAWVRLTIDSQELAIRFGRADGTGWSHEVADPERRGGYFSLTKNYPGGPAVEFRRVAAS